jgi:hypothetical protein
MLRGCFEQGRVSAVAEEDTMSLGVTCRYNIGSEVELEGRFTLKIIPDEPAHELVDTTSSGPMGAQMLNPPQRILSHLLFGEFAATTSSDAAALAPLHAQIATLRADLATVRTELTGLRSENAALQSERATWLSGSASSSSSYHASGTQPSFDGGASSSVADAPGSGSGGAGGQKRKQAPAKPKNMSILNPNSKRRKVGGFRIE